MPVEMRHDPTTRHYCPGKDTYPVHYDHNGTKGWYVISGTSQIKFCPFCGENLQQAARDVITAEAQSSS